MKSLSSGQWGVREPEEADDGEKRVRLIKNIISEFRMTSSSSSSSRSLFATITTTTRPWRSSNATSAEICAAIAIAFFI